MTKKKKLIIFLAVLAMLLVSAVLTGVYVSRTLDLDARREELLKTVKTVLNREVFYTEGSYSFRLRPTFTFTQVVIREKDGASDFITADRLTLKIAILPLLKGNVVLRELALENPSIALIRERSGVFNISDLLEEKKEDLSFKVRRIAIKNGQVSFADRWIAPEGLTTSLEKMDLRLTHPERGKTADFKFSATVVDEGKTGEVALTGTIELSKYGEPLLNSRIDTAIRAKRLNVGWYWPYYSRYVPFKKITGQLDMDTRYRGNFSEFTSRGSMTMHSLHFDYAPIFHAPLKPETLHANYDMKFNRRDLSVDHLEVNVDGVNIRGSCLLKDLHTDDLLIDAKAVTSPIRWESFSHYVPYGVIPKDVADFIEQKIKGGNYRLDEGRLYGRVSQIAHMEKGENYNVLYIRGRAEDGLLNYAPKVPSFSMIAGTLELKGKDFILHNMTGRFGDAPFTLEGKLADYCITTPTSYPFTMKVTPTAKEVAWLLSSDSANKIYYDGKSTLQLSGNGYLNNYNLNGLWDLTPAAYGYADLMKKPAGKANYLTFRSNLNTKEITLSDLRYDLAPLSLDASLKYRHGDRQGLSFAFSTNIFQMGDIAPLLPRISKFSPQGRMRASLKAESGPKDPADLRWGGDVIFTDASFKPSESVKPVTNISGKIHLKGDRLETSQLQVQIGSSTISARGAMTNLKTPEFSVIFSSPLLDMADFGLRHPKQAIRLKHVSGKITLKDRDLQISSMVFHLNDSILNVKGLVADMNNPKIDVTLASPYLDMRDMMLLANLEPARKRSPSSANFNVKADLSIDSGKMDRFTYGKLSAKMMLAENILYLEGITLNALGGKVSGKSRMDLSDIESPRYQFNFKLDKLSLEQGFHLFEAREHMITGSFSAQGDLTAKGGSVTDLKKTVLGNVQIQFEEGTLKKFATLSKILSILNVSQLLKFQLPDMVSGGMPYDKITATVSFKDGVASTRNLFIKSNAMNISVIGHLDMVKGEIFQTNIGVQLFQTVDKAVSLIPVIGWILTDKNRGFMTTYFEVKGKLDDPEVTAVPVKSMARGVFDIFKNIFQLPAKLFTDTGEVILGR
jgi:uncharacterized protein involved in outer membrane biogenesis